MRKLLISTLAGLGALMGVQATAIAADGPLPRIAAGGPLLEGLLEGPVSRGARPSLPLDLRLPKLPEMPNVSEVPESPPQPTPKVRDHAPPAATVLLLPFPTELPPPELLELSLPLALARAAFARRVLAPSSSPSQPAVSTALAVQAAPLQVMPPLASAAAFKRHELELAPPGARAEWFKASAAARRLNLTATQKVEHAPTVGTSTTSAAPNSHTRPTRPMPGENVTCDATLNIFAVGSSKHRMQAWPLGARIGE